MTISDKQIRDEVDQVSGNLTQIFGDSGTQRFAGYITEEYNRLFNGNERIKTLEELRRSDGSIAAALKALKAPLLAVEWTVEGEDEKIEEFVKENIFKMKDRTWKDFLKEALAFLDFGYYPFEIIWVVDNKGEVLIKDLSPRIPNSIQAFEMEDGNPGLTQLIRTDKMEGSSSMVSIPMGKLLLLTNEKEGDDISGRSVLRPAYIHWLMKVTLYKISLIAAERYGAGVPVVHMSPSASEDEKSAAIEMAQNLRTNEQSYIVFPGTKEEWSIEILTPNGNPQGSAIKDNVDHHDTLILRSVLAQFLGLGSGKTGSFALSKDQTSFFLNSVHDIGRYFAEQFTKQVIEKLVKLNFGEDADVPKLKFMPLGSVDYNEMSDVFSKLTNSGLMDAEDPKIKEFVAKTFDLPTVEPEEQDEEEERGLEEELAELEAGVSEDSFDIFEEEEEEEIEEIGEDGDSSNIIDEEKDDDDNEK